jgi:hypothetical protein
VVIVQKDGEHARVLARRLDFLVLARPQLPWRRRTGPRSAVDADEAELLDLLLLVVFDDFVRSSTGSSPSVTITSTLTKSMPPRNVGCGC